MNAILSAVTRVCNYLLDIRNSLRVAQHWSTPVTGAVTVGTEAVELKVGSTRLSGRRRMEIRNGHASDALRIGASDVTNANGFPLGAGQTKTFDFHPADAVAVYAVSETGSDITVHVLEY